MAYPRRNGHHRPPHPHTHTFTLPPTDTNPFLFICLSWTRYRSRDEISGVRASRDPIENLKARIIEQGWADEKELKAIEKEVRTELTASVKAAKAAAVPDAGELTTDVYIADGENARAGADARFREGVAPPFIRMPSYTDSIGTTAEAAELRGN